MSLNKLINQKFISLIKFGWKLREACQIELIKCIQWHDFCNSTMFYVLWCKSFINTNLSVNVLKYIQYGRKHHRNSNIIVKVICEIHFYGFLCINIEYLSSVCYNSGENNVFAFFSPVIFNSNGSSTKIYSANIPWMVHWN